MSIFQKSVLKEALSKIQDSEIESGWNNFKSYFHNSHTQKEILSYKEEEFQMLFLQKLFCSCLDYNVEGENKNLWKELKNPTNNRKADGGIKVDDKVIGVIELKSVKTSISDKELIKQAFDYKSNHDYCTYVITSNFKYLRFYIDSQNAYEEFNLFELTKDQFKLLFLCLNYQNICDGLPKKTKEESVIKEENITVSFYKDYSSFRNDLFSSIEKINPDFDSLILFQKTQKLLDRFLFILFAEDRGLLPSNTISEIINNWKSDISRGRKVSLFENFKEYFNLINIGRPASGQYKEIFAFNGGLFQKDEVLYNINIDDDILFKHTSKLTQYDFNSDVSVNILGHIFEHSLS